MSHNNIVKLHLVERIVREVLGKIKIMRISGFNIVKYFIEINYN